MTITKNASLAEPRNWIKMTIEDNVKITNKLLDCLYQ